MVWFQIGIWFCMLCQTYLFFTTWNDRENFHHKNLCSHWMNWFQIWHVTSCRKVIHCEWFWLLPVIIFLSDWGYTFANNVYNIMFSLVCFRSYLYFKILMHYVEVQEILEYTCCFIMSLGSKSYDITYGKTRGGVSCRNRSGWSSKRVS